MQCSSQDFEIFLNSCNCLGKFYTHVWKLCVSKFKYVGMNLTGSNLCTVSLLILMHGSVFICKVARDYLWTLHILYLLTLYTLKTCWFNIQYVKIQHSLGNLSLLAGRVQISEELICCVDEKGIGMCWGSVRGRTWDIEVFWVLRGLVASYRQSMELEIVILERQSFRPLDKEEWNIDKLSFERFYV